jgi:hypothetical protein
VQKPRARARCIRTRSRAKREGGWSSTDHGKHLKKLKEKGKGGAAIGICAGGENQNIPASHVAAFRSRAAWWETTTLPPMEILRAVATQPGQSPDGDGYSSRPAVVMARIPEGFCGATGWST